VAGSQFTTGFRFSSLDWSRLPIIALCPFSAKSKDLTFYGLPEASGVFCTTFTAIRGHQILALTVETTKCGDSPDPRRTSAELLPLGAPNVPNLPDGGDHAADDNSLTIPSFLLRGHPDSVSTAIHERGATMANRKHEPCFEIRGYLADANHALCTMAKGEVEAGRMIGQLLEDQQVLVLEILRFNTPKTTEADIRNSIGRWSSPPASDHDVPHDRTIH